MENVFYWGNLILSYGVSGYVMLKFMFGLFKPKYRRTVYIFAYFIFVILAIFFNRLNIAIIKSLFGILSICIIGLCLFKADSKKQVIGASILFFLYMLIIDALSVLVFALFSNNTIEYIRGNQLYLFVAGTGNQIMLLCFYRPLLTIMKHHKFDEISIQQNLFLCILAIFEVTQLIFTMGIIEGLFNRLILTVLNIGFLGLDIYLIYLFESISQKYRLEREIDLKEQQEIMQNTYYKTIETQYDHYRRLIHDMKNHIQTLEELYVTGDRDAANEYTQNFYNKIDKMGSRFKCSNRTLTIIMNDKLLKCDENGISVNIEIEDINLDFISSFDMTTIFCNLFDNAIEASIELPIEKRQIKILIFRHKCFIAINISNNYSGFLISEENSFKSTKGNRHMGVGLRNVKDTIEKYNGTLQYKMTEDEFQVNILFEI
ncbi:GHKL domain-containing protein [Eubacterium callanderi]|uniref:GHKL domain-containing protein n=1 Tax=Eubacterium callanderi TaxID=53442 RepID=A0A853JRA2_9FIRM|nr:GHKL domain-containing protein [Eubacterium callanderi]